MRLNVEVLKGLGHEGQKTTFEVYLDREEIGVFCGLVNLDSIWPPEARLQKDGSILFTSSQFDIIARPEGQESELRKFIDAAGLVA